jgi:hypothetical protein
MSLYKKMIDEAVGATKSVYGVLKEKRGGTFKFTDCKPYVDAVNTMKPEKVKVKRFLTCMSNQ